MWDIYLFVFSSFVVVVCKYYTISWEHGLGFEYSILLVLRISITVALSER